MLKRNLLSVAVLAGLTGCAVTQSADQQVVNTLADNLDVQYEVLTNHGANEGLACQDLGAEWASCNKVNMTLVNQGEAVDSKDWAIYFHSIRLILDVDNEQFKITRVTGDLHKLEPTDKFDGFAEGEEVTLPLIGEYWQLFETDFMPGAFVTAPNAEPKMIASLNTEDVASFVTGLEGNNLKRTPDDNNVMATAVTRFEKNADLATKDVSTTLLPTPMSVEVGEGTVNIAGGIALPKDAFDADQFAAIEERADVVNLDVSGDLPVSVAVVPTQFKGDLAKSGAYELSISKEGIAIEAFDKTGAFYAVQSIFGLIDSQNVESLPLLSIQDAPRFDYRGVMVDVARNFHSKEAILATLDQMAAYKMNKLHLHLTDDEGWRLEIPGLPELTEVGANRCFDVEEKSCLLPQLGSGSTTDNFGSGHFSKADYVEILKYATARSIEVIPEIDMPAHARAAVVSMEARYERLMEEGKEAEANEYRLMDPQDTSNVTTVQFYDKQSFINPCMESSTRFVDKVISEVAAMHSEAGAPLTTWHFGGDEAKNIKLGAGLQDINAEDKVSWKGNIDLSKQDKPFAQSPQCQTLIADGTVSDFGHLPSHFAEEVSKIVAEKGIPHFQAWQDGLKYSDGEKAFATESTRVNFWDVLYWGGTSSVYEWSKKGYDVIVSNPDYVYMDMPYEVDAKERGYYWATRATDTRKMFGFAPENMPQNAETSLDRDGNGFTGKGEIEAKPFYGLSAQLWSETVRNDEQYEYMVFPRVLAAAERAWHRADWENDYKVGVEYSQNSNLVDKAALNQDYNRFANVLGQRELAKLEKAGIDYRLPVPGAKIESGKLAMNVQFPGVELQYSADGETWLTYNDSQRPSVEGETYIRSISESGERVSRVTTVK
ncbi:carbohydate-binding domain-containing protein [Vibrio sp. D404a]|uniref:beta-N-acetylhexosaminidase n=3 Tax=Vibrio TaxID=662 RepID=UPI002556C1F7|nr:MULTISPECIES: beta-N-acetylhexosaminidase [unclassified Vibrio]MDK9739208.1 carbohydate-binding domain-containing protein [Vibrio sp. D404a]MDK9798538.1 carbohydate-binding domain-containing protein [Vibrio sp. D449a]